MSETDQQQSPSPHKSQFAIQKLYVKDLSFETPNSPQVFLNEWKPEIKLELSNKAIVLKEGVHEVVLSLTLTAKLEEQTAYLIEVHQAGIFNIAGFSQDDMGAMLGSYCPNILFPYAREVVSDLVSKGGFPQLLLAPVNFEALQAQRLKDQQEKGANLKTTH